MFTVIEHVFLPTAYIQQVGRTGRTGKQATAILFFCRNESTCRRKILNDYFGFMDDTNESENKATLCCNICNPILNEWYSVLPLRQELKSSIRQSLSDYNILNNLEISPYQIESVIHNYSKYVETDSFIQDFGLNQAHAENLCTIIKLSVSL